MTRRLVDQRRLDHFDDRDVQRARAAYLACVDYLDEVLGDLLTMLEREGFLENTIVVYTSDHDEMAGEHGLFGKKSWHESGVRVPLAIETHEHRSGDRPPEDVSAPVNLLDLFSTLCGLCGVETPDDLDGADLSAAVRRGEEPERGPVVCDHLEFRPDADTEFAVGEYRLVRGEDHKYVRCNGMSDLLFDVETDPLEQRNLLDEAGSPDGYEPSDPLPDHVSAAMWEPIAGIDFEQIDEQRRADERRLEASSLPNERSGNQFCLPDGRIVDAEMPLYEPSVVTDAPAAFFADWPGTEAFSPKREEE